MDCKQAWNLMMKHFDKEEIKHGNDELNKHLSACYFCKTNFESLKKSFVELEIMDIKAPLNIEEKVMARLPTSKPKRDFLLPYIAANLIVFICTIIYWIYQLFEKGIFLFLKETFNGAIAKYKASTMVLRAYENFFSNYVLKEAINVLFIAGLIYVIISLLSALQKMGKNRISAS